jgi:hypothetical protein
MILSLAPKLAFIVLLFSEELLSMEKYFPPELFYMNGVKF